MKKIFLYLFLSLFLAEGCIESIKLFLELNEVVEATIEIDGEACENDKDDCEEFLTNFNSLKLAERESKRPTTEAKEFLERSYENISKAVPTPPPDNTL